MHSFLSTYVCTSSPNQRATSALIICVVAVVRCEERSYGEVLRSLVVIKSNTSASGSAAAAKASTCDYLGSYMYLLKVEGVMMACDASIITSTVRHDGPTTRCCATDTGAFD